MISFQCFYAQYHYNKQIITYLQIITILISCGNVGFWDNMNFPNNKWLIKTTNQILQISTLMTGKTNVKITHRVVHIDFLKHVYNLKIILEQYLYYQLKYAVGEESQEV